MSQALKDAINEAWSSAYKGEGPVSDEKALCKRVRMLAYDRADWIKNAKALQKDNTELRSKLESMGRRNEAERTHLTSATV